MRLAKLVREESDPDKRFRLRALRFDLLCIGLSEPQEWAGRKVTGDAPPGTGLSTTCDSQSCRKVHSGGGGRVRLHDNGASGRPYRLVFAASKNGEEVTIVQHCVDSSLEILTEWEWPNQLGDGCILVEVFSAGWLFWDQPEERGEARALWSASHLHRHCRGSARGADGKLVSVAAASAAYSPVFASALGTCWLRALDALEQQKVPPKFD